MTREEQLRRKALKLERKALDRAVTGRSLAYSGLDSMPKRMGFLRRMEHAARSQRAAYREAGLRIAEIGRELASR